MQRAVAADDRSAVAALIRFPMTTAISGFRVPFADAAGFLDRYEDIFNPPLREAIARAKPGQKEFAELVAITTVDGQLRITSIAVPNFAGDPVPSAAPPTEKSAVPSRPAEPRRIAIRVGPRATQIPGTLVPGATDTFILYLPKGKVASVRLERVPSGAATIRVVHAATGAPLGARPSADGRFVSGRPAESGDYRIEVRPGVIEDTHLPYMLSLSLR